uniref:Ent-kaurene synthase-like protein 3 n=1 Tax=Aegilops tauschii TaxID=37682 RepID=N1R153_AEGTA
MMVNPPPGSSSLTLPTARCSSRGGLLCGVLPMRSTRAPRPAVARAVAKNKPQVGGNVASMPNLLGSLNCKVEKKARETQTKKQLHKPEEVPTCQESLHRQLSMVDVLQKIGISRHFASEIKSILDFTYSYWLQRDEIMLDVETCAMAFRILRMNGYNVSAGYWSGHLLRQQLKSSEAQRTPLLREFGGQKTFEELCTEKAKSLKFTQNVEHVLDSPFYTMLDRLEHKRNIEQFDIIEHPILQFWVRESRLNRLPFARQKLAYFYLSAASTMFPPELSDARILWAKNGALTTVVDDFFDVGGSKDELENLTALVEMWEHQEETEYYSEQVEIVFSAIYSSWQELLRNMMTEVEWRTGGYVPTLDEYIENAVVTFALGPIVLPALYFVGPKITESMVIDPEYSELFRLTSTCGRLLNDVQTYEREYKEGKLNSVSLLVLHNDGSLTIPEARRKLQKPIDTCRRDLLRLVLREDDAVPRPCKELFWNICKTCYFFYYQGDAFSCQEEKAGAVDAVIHDPLQLPMNLLSDLDLSTLREKTKINH